MFQPQSPSRGFTLIELMIVIGIVAILTAIAIPAYSDQTRKARRATAKVALLEIVQSKERFHSLNGTYVGSLCAPTDLQVLNHYTITCPAATTPASQFNVLATAIGAQTADALCLNLGINQQGTKTESGSGTVADCW